MGNNLNTINIEFFGLPGSGKSTVSHEMAKKIADTGYQVTEPTYILGHSRNPLSRVMHKFLASIVFSIKHPILTKETRKLVIENEYSGIEKIKQLVNLLNKISIYKKNAKKITIWDEGIAQASISLSINSSIKPVDNYKKIKNIADDKAIIYLVYISTNKQTSFKRMNERQTNDSRVEKAGKEESIALMNNFYDCVNNMAIIADYTINNNKDISNIKYDTIIASIIENSYEKK